MQYSFSHGDIQKLLAHFNMKAVGRKKKMYKGTGNDSISRICPYHYKSKSTPIADGTAKSIAHSLKFGNIESMKEYLNNI